jgi:hypothetical protein
MINSKLFLLICMFSIFVSLEKYEQECLITIISKQVKVEVHVFGLTALQVWGGGYPFLTLQVLHIDFS